MINNKNKNNFADAVVNEMIKGCKARLRKENAKEMASLRSENIKLRREFKKLRLETKDYYKQMNKLNKDKEAVKRAASVIQKQLTTIKNIKDKRIKSFMNNYETNYTSMCKNQAALRRVKMLCKK